MDTWEKRTSHKRAMNLGIDIGGSSIKLGMVSNEGQVIKAIKINLTTDRSPDGVMSLLYDGMDQVVVSVVYYCFM